MPRFFAPDAETTGDTVALSEDEAAHLTRVLRLKAGDSIRVFDGRGREWHAEVSEIAKQRVIVRIGAAAIPAAEPKTLITLAIAVLKGDKMDDVVRDAVMLGVHTIIPLVTDRTEVSAATIHKSGRISRWQRIALSSVKQCGRAVMPAVADTATLAQVATQGASATRVIMLAEPGAANARALRELPPERDVTLLIG